MRLLAVKTLCDVSSLGAFIGLHADRSVQAGKFGNLKGLVQEIPEGLVGELIAIFGRRRAVVCEEGGEDAQRAGPKTKTLWTTTRSRTTRTTTTPTAARKQPSLKAKMAAARRGMELVSLTSRLVRAIACRMIDHSGQQAGKLRRRLLRNETKLGPVFKDVLAGLDESRSKELLNRTKANSAKPARGPTRTASSGGRSPSWCWTMTAVTTTTTSRRRAPSPKRALKRDLRRRELLDDPAESPEPDDAEANGAADVQGRYPGRLIPCLCGRYFSGFLSVPDERWAAV